MKIILTVLSFCFILSGQFADAQVATLSGGGVLNEGVTGRFCVTFDSSPSSDTTVNVRTVSDTAIVGADCEDVNEDLVFSAGTAELQQCVDVDTIVDSSLEAIECFDVVATIDGAEISMSPQTGTIFSTDTVEIGFAQPSYEVTERIPSQVCVQVLEGTIERDSDIPVSVQTSPGTAEEDVDYSGVGHIVNFDRNISVVCFTPNIIDDELIEPTESYTLSLSSSGDITLSSTLDSAQIMILNDDADCDMPPVVENGTAVLSDPIRADGGAQYMAMADYSCDAGFLLNGASQLVCQLSSEWSPLTPGRCEVECSTPPAVTFATVVVSEPNIVGAEATYTCGDGFNLEGNGVLTCQSDGSWPDPPSCEIMQTRTTTIATDGALGMTSSAGFALLITAAMVAMVAQLSI